MDESIKEYLKNSLEVSIKRIKGIDYGRGGVPYHYDNLVVELQLDGETIDSDKIAISELI